MDKLKQFYTTVLWQSFSEDNNFLIASTKRGKIVLFEINYLLDYVDENERSLSSTIQQFYSFQAHQSPLYGFVVKDDLVISGGSGEIKAWSWSSLVNKEIKEPLWSINIPQGANPFQAEVNSLILSSENQPLLFAGCGDNSIYAFEMGYNKPKFILNGHTDYVNCLAYSQSKNSLFSGSEDGSVLIWDLRTLKPVNTIEPHKHQELNRTNSGKWIGTVSLDESSEWMICGGGPSLSSWHLRSMSRGVTFETSNLEATFNISHIYKDLVIAGGSNSAVYSWYLNGKLHSEIETFATSIYSLAISEKGETKLMAIGGTSCKINMCLNFKYSDYYLIVD